MRMKVVHLLLASVLLAGAFSYTVFADKPGAGEVEVYLYIKGITPDDESKIKDILHNINGVSKVEVKIEKDRPGEVEAHVKKEVALDAIKDSLEKAGYTVTDMKIED